MATAPVTSKWHQWYRFYLMSLFFHVFCHCMETLILTLEALCVALVFDLEISFHKHWQDSDWWVLLTWASKFEIYVALLSDALFSSVIPLVFCRSSNVGTLSILHSLLSFDKGIEYPVCEMWDSHSSEYEGHSFVGCGTNVVWWICTSVSEEPWCRHIFHPKEWAVYFSGMLVRIYRSTLHHILQYILIITI